MLLIILYWVCLAVVICAAFGAGFRFGHSEADSKHSEALRWLRDEYLRSTPREREHIRRARRDRA